MSERKPEKDRTGKEIPPGEEPGGGSSYGQPPLESIPTVDALMEKAEKIREAQMNLALKKMHSLSQGDRDALEAMTRALVQEILREPVERIGEGTEQSETYAEVVRRLFRLDAEDTA